MLLLTDRWWDNLLRPLSGACWALASPLVSAPDFGRWILLLRESKGGWRDGLTQVGMGGQKKNIWQYFLCMLSEKCQHVWHFQQLWLMFPIRLRAKAAQYSLTGQWGGRYLCVPTARHWKHTVSHNNAHILSLIHTHIHTETHPQQLPTVSLKVTSH